MTSIQAKYIQHNWLLNYTIGLISDFKDPLLARRKALLFLPARYLPSNFMNLSFSVFRSNVMVENLNTNEFVCSELSQDSAFRHVTPTESSSTTSGFNSNNSATGRGELPMLCFARILQPLIRR